MPPCADAGPDQQVTLAAGADLSGSTSDDGVPQSPGSVTATWSKSSGPGTVSFDDPNNLITHASFSEPGTYVITLRADDGELQNEDELIVNVTDVRVEIKILLEGPYDVVTHAMRTDLDDNSFIPTTAPYAEDTRTVTSVPAGITDWVLVQLRTSPSGPAVTSKSVFLRNDGFIVADDGLTPMITMQAQTNLYYIVIRQRNHLAVMSATAVSLSNSSSTLFDFTTAQSKAYGSNPMKELNPGVYGILTGDGNGDGGVDALDKVFEWRPQNGTTWDYSKFADFNLDGGIDALDLIFEWRPNNGTSTQVP